MSDQHCWSQEDQEQEQEEKEPETHSNHKKKKVVKGGGKRLTDKERVEIIQIHENCKVTKRRLGLKYGVTEGAIRQLLRMKDEILKRYFETPAEIRDRRLRGTKVRLGWAHGLDFATTKAVAAICNTRTTSSSLTSAAGVRLHNNGQYPPDDPLKRGLNAMLAKVSPFLKKFTRKRGQSQDSINVLDASVAAADKASVEGSLGVEDASGAVSELDWVGFSRMLRDIRRTLHRYPETGYQEVRTQEFIKGFCEQLNIPGKNVREMALTGLVVDVCHGNATISPAEKHKLPVIAFRADMDALPIEETNDHLPYCSTQKNGGKELRKRKKRKTSTSQPSSSPKASEDEEDDPQASSDATGGSVVSTDESMEAPVMTLPALSTITTTTVRAPPAPGATAEEDDSDSESSTPAAHMCGHDGHMVIVLGLCALVVCKAHLLPEDTFVRFIFQPAEEGPGGAMKMIEDGALVDVDEVYGLHNAPFPLNSIHVRPGPVMAQEVEFFIKIHGIGSRGPAPQNCVDPILAGAVVVQALQTVVSRSLSPMDTAVVSVTQFRAGDTNNVIPHSALLSGTIRVFDLQVAETIKNRVSALVHTTCASYGATASVHFLDGYAPVINPPVETRNVQQIAMDMNLLVSEEGLPLMAAEDFSYFLQERKGCYFFLGTKDLEDEDKTRALHSNHFDFNDKATPVGIRVFLGILQARFSCELFSAEELESFQLAMERILINKRPQVFYP